MWKDDDESKPTGEGALSTASGADAADMLRLARRLAPMVSAVANRTDLSAVNPGTTEASTGAVSGQQMDISNVTLEELLTKYPGQADEIRAVKASRYRIGFAPGEAGVTFSLADSGKAAIDSDVDRVIADTPVDGNALAGDQPGVSEALQILQGMSGADAAEARITLVMFLYLARIGKSFDVLLAGEPALTCRPIAVAMQRKLPTVLFAKPILENEDVTFLTQRSTSPSVIFTRGLDAFNAIWPTLTLDGDKREYLMRRVTHEANKGYSRRVANASTPLEKFAPFEDLWVSFLFEPTRGGGMFPGADWRGDRSALDQITQGYQLYTAPSNEKDADKKKREIRMAIVSRIGKTVYDSFAARTPESSRTVGNFRGFLNGYRVLITDSLSPSGWPVAELLAEAVAELEDLSLIV